MPPPARVSVLGGQAGRDVVAAEQDLQGSAAADEAPQARHGTAAGNGADADLELAQDRRLDANRMSVARTNSLPAPRVRPRISEIVATGSLLSRTKLSTYGCMPVRPGRILATREVSDKKSQWAMK